MTQNIPRFWTCLWNGLAPRTWHLWRHQRNTLSRPLSLAYQNFDSVPIFAVKLKIYREVSHEMHLTLKNTICVIDCRRLFLKMNLRAWNTSHLSGDLVQNNATAATGAPLMTSQYSHIRAMSRLGRFRRVVRIAAPKSIFLEFGSKNIFQPSIYVISNALTSSIRKYTSN